MKNHPLFILFLCCLLPLTTIRGQQSIDADIRQKAVEDLASKINENYVFPDKGTAISDLLTEKLNSGQYDALNDAVALAEQLTKDIRSVNNDLHLRVRFEPRLLEGPPPADGEEGSLNDFWMRRDNFGFKAIEILPGNIGYIDLRQFAPTELAGETASAAMNFLAGTDAIIFDLRQNGGGSPAMIQLLTTYLYDAGERIHLNSFYFRPADITTQTWILPYVPGKRNAAAEVYVLTSNYTFSAAEEFTYNLQNLERATIVGETTGGGAHPGGMHPIGDRFAAFIPDGRAINPITGTNWEGTGVSPDVEIEADKALVKAQQLALESLSAKAEDEDIRNYYNWQKDLLASDLNPVKLTKADMQAFTGTYGERKISLKDDVLFYQRGNGPLFELKALSPNSFVLKDHPVLKVSFDQEKGKTWMLAEYDDGRKERSERIAP